MKSALLRGQRDAQVVDMRSLTPLEDAQGTRCLQKVEVCQLVERWVCQKESFQQCLGVAEGHVVGAQLLFS